MPACKNHDQCVRAAMQRAIDLCGVHDVRLTSLRRRVLELVWESHKPVKAYDVLRRLQGGAMAPPTVYRALGFLMQNGLVHKLHRWNAYVGCTRPDHPQPCSFLYCSSCGEIEECHDSSLIRVVDNTARRHHFTCHQTMIEIEGICHQCQTH